MATDLPRPHLSFFTLSHQPRWCQRLLAKCVGYIHCCPAAPRLYREDSNSSRTPAQAYDDRPARARGSYTGNDDDPATLPEPAAAPRAALNQTPAPAPGAGLLCGVCVCCIGIACAGVCKRCRHAELQLPDLTQLVTCVHSRPTQRRKQMKQPCF